MTAYRKKLIEVALPLDDINKAAAHEKMPGIGAHPRGIHLWWARRPISAAKAIIFASLVDDPGEGLSETEAKEKREVLFNLIRRLVKWDNFNDEALLREVYEKIMLATGGNPPPIVDPFCGGGSIPLAGQQLGLKAYASDINPIPVLINKVLIEIVPKFAGTKAVHPISTLTSGGEKHLSLHNEVAVKNALAEDVRWYGQWMHTEASKRIGHLYPKTQNGETVIAWIWARTVKCPNPACGGQMPLVKSFQLSLKSDKENWIEPVVDKQAKTIQYKIRQGTPPQNLIARVKDGTKTGRGANFECLFCGTTPNDDHIKIEGQAGRFGIQLMAIVVDSKDGRKYLAPKDLPITDAIPSIDLPSLDADLPLDKRWFSPPLYGLTKYKDLFTQRQLYALSTFSDLLEEVKERVLIDAEKSGMTTDNTGPNADVNAKTYAEAIATILAFVVDRCADFNCSLARWVPSNEKVMNLFARQAIPMVWDFAEANILAQVVGGWEPSKDYIAKCIEILPAVNIASGISRQLDATSAINGVVHPLISTDPPYYDNIGYADLSDFFYVWLRRSLNKIYPELLSTLLTPKTPELVASAYRFGGNKAKAEQFFEEGLRKAFEQMRISQNPDYPLTVYYSFKQNETVAATGWETMLEGLIKSGFVITGTWPIRSEQSGRLVAAGTNALASSIVLVCRPRGENAPMSTRRDFQRTLDKELPKALRILTTEQVAPVDLAQAAIGPGMAVFSRFSRIIEADGSSMRVRTALQLINRAIESYFEEMESDLDSPTRFCLAWYRQYGSQEGPFGEADVLARAKDVSISTIQQAGILRAGQGKVRLLTAADYTDQWNLDGIGSITIWEATQRLVHAMSTGGDAAAGVLSAQLGGLADQARTLAYQLYDLANRKGWLADALAYNNLVAAWSGVQNEASNSVFQHTLEGF